MSKKQEQDLRREDSLTPAPCGSCKYQRRKCKPRCPYANHFSPKETMLWKTVQDTFGAGNIRMSLAKLKPEQRDDYISSIKFEAEARALDPVFGTLRIISHQREIVSQLVAAVETLKAQLDEAGTSRQLAPGDEATMPGGSPQKQHLVNRSQATALTSFQFEQGEASDAHPLHKGNAANVQATQQDLHVSEHTTTVQQRFTNPHITGLVQGLREQLQRKEASFQLAANEVKLPGTALDHQRGCELYPASKDDILESSLLHVDELVAPLPETGCIVLKQEQVGGLLMHPEQHHQAQNEQSHGQEHIAGSEWWKDGRTKSSTAVQSAFQTADGEPQEKHKQSVEIGVRCLLGGSAAGEDGQGWDEAESGLSEVLLPWSVAPTEASMWEYLGQVASTRDSVKVAPWTAKQEPAWDWSGAWVEPPVANPAVLHEILAANDGSSVSREKWSMHLVEAPQIPEVRSQLHHEESSLSRAASVPIAHNTRDLLCVSQALQASADQGGMLSRAMSCSSSSPNLAPPTPAIAPHTDIRLPAEVMEGWLGGDCCEEGVFGLATDGFLEGEGCCAGKVPPLLNEEELLLLDDGDEGAMFFS